jgi:hypothetical protein
MRAFDGVEPPAGEIIDDAWHLKGRGLPHDGKDAAAASLRLDRPHAPHDVPCIGVAGRRREGRIDAAVRGLASRASCCASR